MSKNTPGNAPRATRGIPMSRRLRRLALTACCLLPFAPGSLHADASDQALADAVQSFNDSVTATQQMLMNSSLYLSDVDRAEAHRYLSGIVALAQRQVIHFGDPAFPQFHRSVGVGNDWGFSNPDNLYMGATISNEYDYLVRGHVATKVNHAIFGTFAGSGIDSQAGPGLFGEDLQSSNKLELIVARSCDDHPNARNCLEMHPEATSFAIRQVFDDWEAEKGWHTIERIGSGPETRAPLTSEELAEKWIAAGGFLATRVGQWLFVSEQLAQIPTQLPPQYPIDLAFVPPSQGGNTALGNWFSWGQYDIPGGMALILQMPAPAGADYWGFTLYNGWGEMLDHQNRQTSVNNVQGSVDTDGVLRFVLSDEDPGVRNWVDTTGRNRGFANIRVKRDEEPGQMVGIYVPKAALGQILGAAETVTPEERDETLAERKLGGALRYRE